MAVWKKIPCRPREMPASGVVGAVRAAAVGAEVPLAGLSGTLDALGQKVPVAD